MEDKKKEERGFSAEGRRLRPRRNAGEGRADRREGERVSYGEKREGSFGKPYGERRSFGEHREGGERRPYGDRREGGERRAFGERREYGDRKPYGERRSFGEHREYGDRKPYGERRSFGERREYGDRKPYGERRSFGERREGGERKPYGERRGYEKRESGKRWSFNERDERGIGRMLERKAAQDESRTAADAPAVPVKEEVRLNKFIANSGVCSRREADEMIQAGVVTVNGEVVTELGTKVNIYNDDVRFNGERLHGEEKVYIVMNKPKGYVTTASDPHADKTVMDLLKGARARVFPVGRLDKNTTGVLLFTNDGEMAERLTHPSYDKKKIYQVILDSPLTDEDHDKILQGITLTDGDIAADELEFIDAEDRRKLGIEIHSGKNRIVRRIFESLGYEVKALDRVYFAGLTKKGLKKGEWRVLSEGEVNILKMGAYV